MKELVSIASHVVPENDLLPEEHIEGSESDKIDEV